MYIMYWYLVCVLGGQKGAFCTRGTCRRAQRALAESRLPLLPWVATQQSGRTGRRRDTPRHRLFLRDTAATRRQRRRPPRTASFAATHRRARRWRRCVSPVRDTPQRDTPRHTAVRRATAADTQTQPHSEESDDPRHTRRHRQQQDDATHHQDTSGTRRCQTRECGGFEKDQDSQQRRHQDTAEEESLARDTVTVTDDEQTHETCRDTVPATVEHQPSDRK